MADLVGLLAGALVLAAFAMPTMLALRAAAIGSNLAFIAYGWLLGLAPILILHGLLLPINLAHLGREFARRRRRAGAS